MSRRRIGQERLALDGSSGRSGSSLDEMATLIDWPESIVSWTKSTGRLEEKLVGRR